MKLNVIITGTTGMVGEGVLYECLRDPSVGTVLAINRKPCGVNHPKLTEIIHKDFMNLSPVEDRLAGYNACFFCAGVSSIGKKEEEYKKITYDLTLSFAQTILKYNPEMTFIYVSGEGTDSTEKGKSKWARIKGKTENDLLKLPFRSAYMFRPGYIQPIKNLKNTYTVYKFLSPFYFLWKLLFPKYVVRLEEIGMAMIKAAAQGSRKTVLSSRDISELAKQPAGNPAE